MFSCALGTPLLIKSYAPTCSRQRGAHNFFCYCLAIRPAELDKLIKPASGLEEGVGQVEREGRAIALLPGLQVRQQSADVGEEEIMVESAC